MTKEDLIKNLGTIAKSGTSGATMLSSAPCYPNDTVIYAEYMLRCVSVSRYLQHLWKRCRQGVTSISSGSLVLGSTQFTWSLTMLKFLASTMMTYSKKCCIVFFPKHTINTFALLSFCHYQNYNLMLSYSMIRVGMYGSLRLMGLLPYLRILGMSP